METVKVKIVPDDASEIIGKQLIGIGVAIIATVVLVYVQRKAMEPDFFLSLKMRGLNSVAQYADHRAKFWHDVANKASTLYLDSRA